MPTDSVTKNIGRFFSLLVVIWMVWSFATASFEYIAWGAFDDLLLVMFPVAILIFLAFKISFYCSTFTPKYKAFFCLVLFLLASIAAIWFLGIFLPEEYFYSTICLLIGVFALSVVKLFSAPEVSVPTSRVKVVMACLTMACLIFFSEFISDSVLKSSGDQRAENHQGSIQITDIKDESIYAHGGNPIGLRLSYSIMATKEDFKGISKGEFKNWLSQNYDPSKPESQVSGLNVVKAEINPPLETDISSTSEYNLFLKKGQVYRVVLYAIPHYLFSSDVTKRPIPELDSVVESRLEGNTITSLDGLCIYRTVSQNIERESSSLVGPYSTDFKIWRVSTNGSHDAKSFFNNLQMEGVKTCPASF